MKTNFLRKKVMIKETKMKKYLLLIEDVKIWEKFKELIDRDINTEILDLIKNKIKKGKKNGK